MKDENFIKLLSENFNDKVFLTEKQIIYVIIEAVINIDNNYKLFAQKVCDFENCEEDFENFLKEIDKKPQKPSFLQKKKIKIEDKQLYFDFNENK